MAHEPTRRNFLWTAPLAAAAALPMTDTLLHAATDAAGQEPQTQSDFQLFSSETIDGITSALASKAVFHDPNMVITVSAEEHKSGKEYEYHLHHEHVFYVLDGSTKYELGGTPKNTRLIRPGEWLAPECEGFKTVTLNKGDILVIQKMTPHRRVTESKVSLLLVNLTIA